MTRCVSVAVAVVFVIAGAAGAVDDFEGFAPGSVNGQGGWTVGDMWGNLAGPAFDEEVKDDGSGTNNVWRLSNAVARTSYSDQPFSPTTAAVAGETGAHLYNDFGPLHTAPVGPPGNAGAVATTNRFYAYTDFWSDTGAAQSGLSITLSPSAKQSSVRMSYLNISDSGTGLDLLFYDTNDGANFFPTTVATGLSYGGVHSLAFDITFVDGLDTSGGTDDGNDVVDIYVNGALVHTGTTWESYYDAATITTPQAVDSLLFRVSSAAAGTSGGGLCFDNVEVNNGATVIPLPAAAWMGLALLGGMGGVGALRRKRCAS